MAAKRTAPGPALSLPEPSKNTGFTPELGRQIVANLDRGLMDGDTALLCGVHRHTLQSWINRGFEPDADPELQEFAWRYVVATLELEQEHVDNILDAANPDTEKDPKFKSDWKAAAWYLERRFPGKWGKSVPESGPVEMIRFPMEIRDRKALSKKILGSPPPELTQQLARMGYKLVRVDEE